MNQTSFLKLSGRACLLALALGCASANGCAAPSQNGHLTSFYSGGSGYSYPTATAHPSLPGPDYYQSSNNPFHAD